MNIYAKKPIKIQFISILSGCQTYIVISSMVVHLKALASGITALASKVQALRVEVLALRFWR